MYLDAMLADEPLTGGLEPRLGDAHLRMLTVIGFPTADLAGPSRRTQPAGLSLSLVDPRDLLDKTDATKVLTRSAGNGSPSASRSRRS